MRQTLHIPDLSPNLNEVLGMNARHWGIYAGKKRQWADKIYVAVMDQQIMPHKGAVGIELQLTYPTRRKRDPDNILLKFLLDGLVKSGIITDDTFEYIKEIKILPPKVEKGVKATSLTIWDME